jgi:hypothetical protein
MDVPDWFRYTIIGLGLILTPVCVWYVVRSVRRLNRRIEEFRAELDARQGAPLDPYAALAEIYAEEAARDAARRSRKRSKTRR